MILGSLNKKTVYWTLQIAGWSFYAFLHILLVFVDNGLDKVRVISIVFIAGFFLISTHFYRLIVLKLGWFKQSMLNVIPRILLSSFFLAITWYVFKTGLSFFLNTLDYERDFVLYEMLVNVFAAMVFYLLWAAIYFLFHYVERTYAGLKYEAAIYESELNQLKSQLNPHFIFNALNSIRALIDEDPLKSKSAITQLSNILRNSLIINRRKLVDLRDEIKTVRDYLALESIRFEERLTVRIEIDPITEFYQVPPLMIQTLVENGIKHGISKLKPGGIILISTSIDHEQQLILEIRNSGQLSDNSNKNNPGFGLENTRRRLNLLFGENSSLSIANEDENTVLTKIIIPQSRIHESIDH
jgi:two-component system LytT family sensor kinase